MIFREDQRINLRNLLREATQEKANMSTDVPNYLHKQEYLRGQLDILMTLLASDEAALINLQAIILEEKGE